MEISASVVMELREKTGLGMMLCKKALIESNGNMEQAIESLRKRARPLWQSAPGGWRSKGK